MEFLQLKSKLSELENASNSEQFIKTRARANFVKRILHFLLRPHTRIQTYFNTQVIESLQLLLKYIKTEMNSIYAELNSRKLKSPKKNNRSAYTSVYFPSHEEKFYAFQQEKFRGSFHLIKDRQAQYKKFLHTIKSLNITRPFVEVGFGRGEFLDILKETGIKNVIGIETNKARVKELKGKGYNTIYGNAIEFLRNYKGEISGLSAFHVAEHMPFEELFDLIYIAYEKLAENGLVIIETPNPENLQVGSYSFYIDHTHITKLPPKFLESIFEYAGFKTVKTVYSTPLRKNIKTETDRLLYGDLDYAVVAYK